MPVVRSDFKNKVKSLNQKTLQEIIVKVASKDKMIYDFIFINYIDKETGEQMLFEATIEDLDKLFEKNFRGYSEILKKARMLAACIKRINLFTKVSKNKVLEARLLMHVLGVPFSIGVHMFGSGYTTYDTKVAMLLKRLINVVTNKLHEDYVIEYADFINKLLNILHSRAGHIYTVSTLPKSI